MRNKYIYSVFIFILAINSASKAQDRVFARTYQSNILAKGDRDLEIWNTYSFGRENFYTKLHQRFEFEIGLSNKLQTSLYLNREQISYALNSKEGTLIKTESSNISFSNEWKYKISDPVADKMGFALYGEILAGTDKMELEGKLIFDKQIEKHLFAFNIVSEVEMEFEAEEQNKTELETEETALQLDFGYMYTLGKGFCLGAELVNDNIFEKGEWMNSPLFAGPTLSYAADKWWIIFNALPQITNFKKEEGITGNLELEDHEKMDFRLIFAFNF
jgi:hypothetical protein